jgi:hypothetical protein
MRKKKGRGGERLTGGAQASARAKKRKRERERRAGAGRARWAGRPDWAERLEGKVFLFFQTSFFKTTFLFKFKSNSFQTFPQKFINLLETTQAIKNHASQLMMHNHLLSLCLLNYV